MCRRNEVSKSPKSRRRGKLEALEHSVDSMGAEDRSSDSAGCESQIDEMVSRRRTTLLHTLALAVAVAVAFRPEKPRRPMSAAWCCIPGRDGEMMRCDEMLDR